MNSSSNHMMQRDAIGFMALLLMSQLAIALSANAEIEDDHNHGIKDISAVAALTACAGGFSLFIVALILCSFCEKDEPTAPVPPTTAPRRVPEVEDDSSGRAGLRSVPRDTRPVCRYYLNGNCRDGASCRFSHTGETNLERAMRASETESRMNTILSPGSLPTLSKQKSFEKRHFQRQHSSFGLHVSTSGRVQFVRNAGAASKKNATAVVPLSGSAVGGGMPMPGIKPAWVLRYEAGGKMSWLSARDGYRLDAIKGIEFAELERVAQLRFFPKMTWFRQQMNKLQFPFSDGHVDLVIDRDNLLSDSVKQVMALKGKQLRQQWRVKFKGEKGLDAGGVTREWIDLTMKQLFDPNNGLFRSSAIDQLSYQIHPSSALLQPAHKLYFQFCGRMLARTLLFLEVQPAHLIRPLFKHLIGTPVSLSDLAFFSSDLYSGIAKLYEVSADQIEDVLCLDFTITTDGPFGQKQIHELLPGGEDIPLTGENRDKYVSLMVKYYLYDSIETQLSALLRGFYEIVPHAFVSVFDFQELELLICGLPEIDMDDWRRNVVLDGYKDTSDPPVRWFFDVLVSYSQADRAKVLQFATGTSRVPVGGFSQLQSHGGKLQKFTLKRIPRTTSKHPRAYTCFNRVELPAYKSLAQLKEALDFIINLEESLEFSLE